MEQERVQLEDIEEFFRDLWQNYEEYQRYFAALATLPAEPIDPPIATECGDSTVFYGGFENA